MFISLQTKYDGEKDFLIELFLKHLSGGQNKNKRIILLA